ncbi:MAG: TIGR04282 family arsenosugar biosynthesis glycosyltransferase [Gammaproteobacteria bacterium]
MDIVFRYPRGLLIQFAKAPVPGQVKSRMHPVLSGEQSAALHRTLVRHTLGKLALAQLAPVELWISAPHPFFTALADLAPSVMQAGYDLGERMWHAFETALPRARPVVLVGSDCPFFSARYLLQAFHLLLAPDVDAVLGPAEDGGYVLLGLKRNHPQLFMDVDWGTGQVLEQTRDRLRQLGWRWRELPALADIDEPADLELVRDLGIF